MYAVNFEDLSPDVEVDITLLRRPAEQVEWLEKIAQKASSFTECGTVLAAGPSQADLSEAPDLIRTALRICSTYGLKGYLWQGRPGSPNDCRSCG